MQTSGGRAFLNGGTVRDFFLDRTSKIWIWKFKVDEDTILQALKWVFKQNWPARFWRNQATGQADWTFDISMPRTDQLFPTVRPDVEFPQRSIKICRKRRPVDAILPINAMYADPINGDFASFWRGSRFEKST